MNKQYLAQYLDERIELAKNGDKKWRDSLDSLLEERKKLGPVERPKYKMLSDGQLTFF